MVPVAVTPVPVVPPAVAVSASRRRILRPPTGQSSRVSDHVPREIPPRSPKRREGPGRTRPRPAVAERRSLCGIRSAGPSGAAEPCGRDET
jgi:hypothetical protein